MNLLRYARVTISALPANEFESPEAFLREFDAMDTNIDVLVLGLTKIEKNG